MPDDNSTPTPVTPPADDAVASTNFVPTPAPSSDQSSLSSVPSASATPASGAPGAPDASGSSDTSASPTDTRSRVSREIADSENVLVALSSDPSVDEMAAAIGLSLYLDRLGKRATAIYSGTTPNALEFLKPEDTFEPTADTLQDFVVALNKEKADHVRCKVDGDYVKMYITPYRSKVSEEDLEFSYGDYNVDLVLALDVANGIDLDSALREHGRIMHSASVVNITTGNPGRFGEIEWNDKSASSVSEMIADLILNLNSKEKLSSEEATAFLTGIVAATDRFSTASTTSKTMKIASRLMEAGANQQLISQNITDDIENEMFNLSPIAKPESKKEDATNIEIEHSGESKPASKSASNDASANDVSAGDAAPKDASSEGASSPDSAGSTSDSTTSSSSSSESPASSTDGQESNSSSETSSEGMSQESSLLADLQKAAASLAQAGDETVPVPGSEPIKIDSTDSTSDLLSSSSSPTLLGDMTSSISSPDSTNGSLAPTGTTISPSTSFGSATLPEPSGASLESAMDELLGNPAAANAPEVPSKPEINGVPEINYAPASSGPILPPPPAPPIDENSFTPNESILGGSDTPSLAPMPNFASDSSATSGPDLTSDSNPVSDTNPASESSPAPSAGDHSELTLEPTSDSSLGSQPAMQDQVYNPAAADPGAFKIPGM